MRLDELLPLDALQVIRRPHWHPHLHAYQIPTDSALYARDGLGTYPLRLTPEDIGATDWCLCSPSLSPLETMHNKRHEWRVGAV